MAFATLSALAHGLGAITFGGVFKLANGKILLFESGGTSIWEMADETTAAVLIHTASFALFAGAAGRHVTSALDRIVIAGNEDFCHVEYDGTDVATVTEVALPAEFVGQTVTKVTYGNSFPNFYVIGSGQAAAYLLPGDPTGITANSWADGMAGITTLRELPGRPVSMNSWGLQAAIPAYDASDIAVWTAGGFYRDFLARPASLAHAVNCFYRGKPNVWILGAELGRVVTDVAGADTAATRDIIAAFFTDLDSLYLIAEEGDGGGQDILLHSSPDGLVWATAAIVIGIDDMDVTPDRAFFASLVTNNFFVYNQQVTGGTPNPRWWITPDGLAWTLKDASLPGIVLGFYSNGGAGPTKIIKFDTATGNLTSSSDEGVTFPTSLIGAIPAVSAAGIRWIEETPTGLIAWGPNGEIFEQVAASLDTVAWTDRSFTEGYIGERNLRVDDSGNLTAHRRYLADVSKENHWDTWEHNGSSWALKSLPHYINCDAVGIEFRDIYASRDVLGKGLFIASIGGGKPGAQMVVGFFTSQISVDEASWISDIDPERGVITTGYKNLIVLGGDTNGVDQGRFKYTNSFNFSASTTTSRQTGWNESEEKFKDEFGTQKLVVKLFADQDVVVAMSFDGTVGVSADAKEWAPVVNDPELTDGHPVVS